MVSYLYHIDSKTSCMKHVSILVLHDSVMASIVDARTMFAGVNEFLEAEGRSPEFTLQL